MRAGGGGRARQTYLDFVIDGRSLLDLLGPEARDTCGCLGWGEPGEHAAAVGRLQLEAEPSIAGEREPLYVCAACGDLACGAVTARITMSAGLVRWDRFAFENGWDPDALVPLDRVGPFTFELGAYHRTLGGASPPTGP